MELKKVDQLPLEIMTTTDVNRLLFEISRLNNYWLEVKLRGQGQSTKKPPELSPLLSSLVKANQLNLLTEADRQALEQFLSNLKQRAPRLHISFAAEPSKAFLGKLVQYLRGNIHPLALLTVGLQPTIGIGCTVRTTNRLFDLSLRRSLSQNASLLKEQLKASHQEMS